MPRCFTFTETMALAAVAFISGSANGYNGTVNEGAIPRLRSVHWITDSWQSAQLASMLSLGGLIGSIACTEIAYRLSRRHMVVIGEMIIILGVLTFALAPNFSFILLGRAMTGFGVGICGLAKPLIVSELAPPQQRGFLVSLFAVGQSIGMNIFYLVDWALPTAAQVPWMWRVIVLLGASPAVAVVILALTTAGTPYWDVAPSEAPLLDGEISPTTARKGSEPLQLLHKLLTQEEYTVRRNFFLVIALMFGYNLSGTLVIANYAGDMLAAVGASDRALPIAIGVVQFLGLVSAALGTDRFGRRPLMLLSCGATSASLFAISALLSLQSDGASTSLLLLFMVAVEYAVGAGLNPIRIVLSAELMPTRYRPLGMALGNAVGWGMALVTLFLFPILSAAASGPAPQFAFFGVVVAMLTVLLVFTLPETAGLDLD